MADMFQQLKEDHLKIKNSIQQCLYALDIHKIEPSKEKIMDIQQQWLIHMKLEEDFLYPEMKKINETSELIDESYQEHKIVKKILDDLVKRKLTADICKNEGKELLDTLEFHIKKEESELFPLVKQYLKTEEIQTISQYMQQFREKKLAKKV